MKKGDRLIKRVEIWTLIGIEITELCRREREGTFIDGTSVGVGQRWKESEVMEWAKTWKK
jgi:predicted DNA-binding transcriptional regulator AlpA